MSTKLSNAAPASDAKTRRRTAKRKPRPVAPGGVRADALDQEATERSTPKRKKPFVL